MGSIGAAPPKDICFGPRSSGPRWDLTFNKPKICWQRCIAKFGIDIQSKIPSWSITAVLPVGADAPIILVGGGIQFPHWSNARSENEGALIRYQSFFSKFGLAASSKPKCTSEGGDHNSCQRSNAVMVSINKSTRAIGINRNSGPETGWLFFGGGIGFGILLFIYAALKTWGKRAFRRHKYRHQNRDGS